MIDFLDELGNFKQKNFYTSKCYILKCQGRTTQPKLIVNTIIHGSQGLSGYDING